MNVKYVYQELTDLPSGYCVPEGHNLDRARTQFKLVRDMEEQFDNMSAVIAKYT